MATNVYLKSKIEERTSQATVLDNLQKTAADAKRDLTDDERKTFDSIVGRLAFLDSEIKRLTDAEAGAAQFVKIYGAHAEAEAAAAAARDRERDRSPRRRGPRSGQSWGTRFIESEQFKAYGGHGASQPFKIEGRLPRGARGLGRRAGAHRHLDRHAAAVLVWAAGSGVAGAAV